MYMAGYFGIERYAVIFHTEYVYSGNVVDRCRRDDSSSSVSLLHTVRVYLCMEVCVCVCVCAHVISVF